MRFAVLLTVAILQATAVSAQQLRVYFIDVDQADATLIVSPSGQTLLVDSGRNGHGSRLQAAMQAAGVTQIDHFVATHYHEDHYGGIDDLVNAGVTVVNSYDRGDKLCCLTDAKRAQQTFIDYENAVGTTAEHLTRGETIPLDPAMTVTVVTSGGVVLGEPDPPEHAGRENDMSIGLLITSGNFRFWVGGDVENPTERKISERDLVMDLDVYQANHHGAENGSLLALLQDMSPTVIVISNGSNRTYDHPRLTTLTRMQALSPAPTIFQTNKYLGGDPEGSNVTDSFIADPETTETDGTITLTVDAGAGTYAIAYGTQSHTFNIKQRATTNVVVIEALLPNPTSDPDRIAETVTLRNDSSAPVSMDGWMLRDAGGRVWVLTTMGTIGAGASATVQRNGMPVSLNNTTAETIELLDASGRAVDSFSYRGSQPDVVIQTMH